MMMQLLLWRLIVYPYSLYFCLRYLPFSQAVHIPILVSPFIKIGELYRGSIFFTCKVRRSLIVWGFNGTEGRDSQKTFVSVHKKSKIVFCGSATITKGTRIVVTSGSITFGNNFICNANCFFNCTSRIIIGDDNMYGWDIQFNTSDGHWIYDGEVCKPNEGNITIGNHVWIASYCQVMKGVEIPRNCVVAQNSLLTKRFSAESALIGGVPAKIMKMNINWKP